VFLIPGTWNQLDWLWLSLSAYLIEVYGIFYWCHTALCFLRSISAQNNLPVGWLNDSRIAVTDI